MSLYRAYFVLGGVDPIGENVYVIDGTGTKWSNPNISNSKRIFRISNEKSYYWDGPGLKATGLDSAAISRNVFRTIKSDWCEAKRDCGEITINLFGWSRGAVIALKVVRDLEQKGIDCDGKVWKPVDVNFLGMFDAVDMTKALLNDYSVPSNLKKHAHAMKSKHQTIFPTIPFPGQTFWKIGSGEKTDHTDIGRRRNSEAYNWVVGSAISAGVDLTK